MKEKQCMLRDTDPVRSTVFTPIGRRCTKPLKICITFLNVAGHERLMLPEMGFLRSSHTYLCLIYATITYKQTYFAL